MLDFHNLDLLDSKPNYKPEPLLIPSESRFVLFPITHTQLWTAYKSLESQFWTAEEISIDEDTDAFQQMNGKQKMMVVMSLIMLQHVDKRSTYCLSSAIQVPEARCYYGFEIMQSNIHLELVSLLLTQLVHPAALPTTIAINTGEPQEYIPDATEFVTNSTGS
jgi:ribonucleotide reductase beta subunit family protein with ferritin-like domain